MSVKTEQCLVVDEPKISGGQTPFEAVASYFRGLARRGLGCTTNNHSIAQILGLSVQNVRDAKKVLVQTKRLTGQWGQWFAIDGERFSVGVTDELETLKTVLRRHYPLVCDARVVEKTNAVPLGKTTHLIVGIRRMSVTEATDLAERLVSTSAQYLTRKTK